MHSQTQGPPSSSLRQIDDMSYDGSAQGEDEATWDTSATRSLADPAQGAQVETFCSVTGADADTAVHVLEAHHWDMDRSVMFFLEGGASAQPSAPALPAVQPDYQAAQAPIVVDDDSPPVPSRQPAFAASVSESAPPSEQDVSSSLPQFTPYGVIAPLVLDRSTCCAAVGHGSR